MRHSLLFTALLACTVPASYANERPGLPAAARSAQPQGLVLLAADEGPRGQDHPRGPDRDDDRPRRIDSIIERAYREVLEREPDANGREHYRRLLAQGWSEELVRAELRKSVEYRVNLPDSKTMRAYREVLGRDADPRGIESYRKKLVDRGWTEQDVEADLRKSSEFRQRPVEEMVRACYREVFGRDPDRDTLARWARQMRDRGWTVSQLRAQVNPGGQMSQRDRDNRDSRQQQGH
jgi:ParB-like chromosome segregation protein Spo0J